jgi:hypothetical protein
MRLVQIESFLTTSEADCLCAQLEAVGIPHCHDNLAFVQWCWPYSYACGGVKVFVREEQLAEAQELLDSDDAESDSTENDGADRLCRNCAADMEPGWDACWRCGSSDHEADDVTLPQSALRGEVIPPNNGPADGIGEGDAVLPAICKVLVCGVAFLALGPRLGMVVYTAMILTKVLSARLAEMHAASLKDTRTSDESKLDTPQLRRDEIADALALRVWRSAVFGFLYFPPLLVYSVYLLRRLSRRGFRLSDAAMWERRCAIFLMLFALFLVGWGALVLCTDGLAPFIQLNEQIKTSNRAN